MSSPLLHPGRFGRGNAPLPRNLLLLFFMLLFVPAIAAGAIAWRRGRAGRRTDESSGAPWDR
ncbi:hypothetical protein ACFWIQ_25095 [Kitasatospora sp. NPDC127059]|uniref:hypothetical protein n=1 Tax=unclassified Kitasatospora TaxID=2633591 RepID=UPI003658C40D